MERTLVYQPAEVIYDRGGRGISEINGVKVQTSQNDQIRQTVATNG